MEVAGMPKRPKLQVAVTAEQRDQLQSIVKSQTMPAALVMRARIILLTAAETSNQQIMQKLGLSHGTVWKWQRRFLERGIAGLEDELRPGRPRSVSDEQVAGLVKKTLNTRPKDGTHWSVRQVAAETKLTNSTVHRIWHAFGLQPHRQKQFKLSNDPFFIEKVR